MTVIMNKPVKSGCVILSNQEILHQLSGALIVSCQALEHEPLYSEKGGIMPRMALAAMRGGAKGIRANTVRDIKEIKETIDLPVIGIIKKEYDGYEPYITPTMTEIESLVEIGTEVIAFDCTRRARPDGFMPGEWVSLLKKTFPRQLFMADISTYDEGIAAYEAGIDMLGTTLYGYTSYTANSEGPAYELVERLGKAVEIPVIAEGKVHYPYEARRLLELGAYAVVVGGAITRPMEITERFMKEVIECTRKNH